jgi:hypothetical protein
MISIWFHRDSAGGEPGVDLGGGNLSTSESSGESWRGALPIARKCVVGRGVAAVWSYFLF